MERRVDYSGSGGRAPRGARGRGCGGAPLGSGPHAVEGGRRGPPARHRQRSRLARTSPTSCATSSRACATSSTRRAPTAAPRRAAGHGRLQPGARGHGVRLRPGARLPRAARARHHRPGGRRRPGGAPGPGSHAVHRLQQVGRHHGDGQLSCLLLRAARRSSWAPSMPARTSWPSPTRARRWSGRRWSRTSAPSSSTPPTSAAATRRCRSSAWCRRPSWASTSRRCSTGAAAWPKRADPTCRRPRTRALRVRRRARRARPGAAATSSRFVASPAVGAFGAWVEQLVAESTGKEGRGILPVDRRAAGRRRRPTATTAPSCTCAWHGADAGPGQAPWRR